MKRFIKIVLIVVVVLIVAIGALLGPAFIGRQAITDGVEFNGVRIVQDGFVSVGVVNIGSGKVALIDAGNDGAAAAILNELKRRGLGPEAVGAIFITHGHQDHTAGIKVFPGAEVMALEREVGLVEGTEGARGPLTRLMPVRPTGVKVARRLRDGETVAVGTTDVRVFAVPGHTAGSAAYLVNGVLFLGDAADMTPSGAIRAAPWVFSDSQSEDRESLAQLAGRLRQARAQVTVLAFAHSGVRNEGINPLIAFARANQ